MNRRAFTLVELLVVISVIALLIGLLLPALGRAKDAMGVSKCLSNLHQITVAQLRYESDNRRLPLHVYEWGDPKTFPGSIKGADGGGPGGVTCDARPLYEPYMNVDFFACPALAPWKPSTATPAGISMDYILTPGYWGDGVANGPSTGTFTNLFTHSERPWCYNGKRFTVLAGDKSYLDPVSVPGLSRNIVNHAKGGPEGFAAWSPPGFGGQAYLGAFAPGVDRRREVPTNYAFVDGSARTFKDSTDLVALPCRHTDRIGGDFLVPAK